MDELIKMVSERAGIDADQARKAIETVVEQLEGKLPGPLAGQLKSLLGGNGADGDSGSGLDVGDLADKAQDLLKGFGR